MPACPKPRPKLLDKRDKAAKVGVKDRIERDKCRARSGGQCEVWEEFVPLFAFEKATMHQIHPVPRMVKRCRRRSSQNHHLIGGSGRRNKGRSILAAHRLDVCDKCHDEITGRVLVPVDGTMKEDAATVLYERIK